MAVIYQTSGSDGTFSASSQAVTCSFNAGSNPIFVAIVTTYETSGTPKDVTAVSRAGQGFTEATNLRQDLTVTGARFNRRKVFVFYRLGSATAGVQTTTATLSGTAAYVSMSVVQYLGAYQGAEALDNFIIDHGENVSGNLGFSTIIVDTRIESILMAHINMFKSVIGGNSFTFYDTVNIPNSAGASDLSVFWANVTINEPVASEFETIMSTRWKEVATGADIAGDWIMVAIEIKDSAWTPLASGIDPAGYCAYVSQGEVRKMVTTISGLGHLENETIKVQVDGVLPEGDNAFLVTNASITLPNKAAVVHAGLRYDGIIKLLKTSDAGGKGGSGQAQIRRIFNSIIRLVRSLGLKIGMDEDHLDPIFDGDPVLPLITEDVHKTPNATWDDKTEMVFKMEDPLPCQILAIILESEVEGRN